MSVDVIMPKLGESITEGTILEWKKKVGEDIGKDETLLEISTDKVDSEVPSPSQGKIIEILYKVNDVVPVGEVIARIGGKSDDIVKSKPADKQEKKVEKIKEEPPKKIENKSIKIDRKDSKRFYSPLVRAIAKKENIPLSQLDVIEGSGNKGRVNKTDILNYLSNKGKTSSELIEDLSPRKEYHLENKTEPMDHVRKIISKHMIKSKETSVHVYSTLEVDMTKIVEFRNKNKDVFKSRFQTPLTYTPFILDTVIKGIHEYPLMNALIEKDDIKYNQNINIGVAVALPDDNLIVPVIKKSEELNFLGIARATADLANRARTGKLDPSEATGSTFTVTNPGVFGSLFGMGIINQPNLGLLSVGSIHKRPVVKETEYGDVIVVRSMVYLTLAYDHRLIDGAYGTKFLSNIKNHLESFNDGDIKL